jgi:hypothetical protein
LAKWFHFPPSEIRGLDWIDFERWVNLAVRQIRERNSAIGRR